jgi:hypothetical protein
MPPLLPNGAFLANDPLQSSRAVDGEGTNSQFAEELSFAGGRGFSLGAKPLKIDGL